jgi:hypothetical protein
MCFVRQQRKKPLSTALQAPTATAIGTASPFLFSLSFRLMVFLLWLIFLSIAIAAFGCKVSQKTSNSQEKGSKIQPF